MRLLRPLVSTLLGAASVLVLAGSPAQADPPDPPDPLPGTCAVTSDVSYAPGLTLTPQTVAVTVHAHYTGCVFAIRPDITSGERTGTFSSSRSCLTTPTGNTTTSVITWNTGETSTLDYQTQVTTVGGQTVFTASVTVVAGVFAGHTGTEVIAQASPNLLECLTPGGLTQQTGAGTLLVVGS